MPGEKYLAIIKRVCSNPLVAEVCGIFGKVCDAIKSLYFVFFKNNRSLLLNYQHRETNRCLVLTHAESLQLSVLNFDLLPASFAAIPTFKFNNEAF